MESDHDFLGILSKFTEYVQNERVRSYNEGVDAERLRCEKIVQDARQQTTDLRSIISMIRNPSD